MIRMIQSQSAEQAKDYHNDALSQSDYFLNDQELKGSFRGLIAKRLGIEGQTQKQDFDALCENINPATLQKLTSRNVHNRTVGYDINFHCPKSVSVLHVLSKDDHVLKAFQQSVYDTMLDIEQDSKTRVRKKSKDEDRSTGELIWGEFIHQTARPVKNAEPDPHLHIHCFVFNVTWDREEAKYKAGQFRDIKADMPYYQAMFHKRLADQLIALGYQVRRTDTSFEIAGIPEKVIGLFSKRTNEIGQLAKEANITNAKELDKLGARSRAKKKKGLSMADLKKDWRCQIRAAGLSNAQAANSPIRDTRRIKGKQLPTHDCINYALDHHLERKSVADSRRVLATAYRHATGDSASDVKGITTAFAKNSAVIQVKDGSRVYCTTKAVLAEEKEMIRLAMKGKGKLPPLLTSKPVTTLSDEQQNAVIGVLSTKDRISIIEGRAGTGKTTLMKEAARLIGTAGKQLTVVAPTAQASRDVLRKEGFANAETVATLLSNKQMQKDLVGQVLWVDESGLESTKNMSALLELAERANARLILSGDTRQHTSFNRGDALRLLKIFGDVPAFSVATIYRQQNDDYKQAVQHLSMGKISKAFGKLDELNAIKQLPQREAYNHVADDYAESIKKGKKVLIISPTHREGEKVTQAVREKLKSIGKLGKKETLYRKLSNLNLTQAEKSDYRTYKKGYQLQFNQNRQGIARGSLWSVAKSDKEGVLIENNKKQVKLSLTRVDDFDAFEEKTIALSKGDLITVTRNGFDKDQKRINNGQSLQVLKMDKKIINACIPQSKAIYTLSADFGHLMHGYCVTSHASQGKTVDRVLLMQPAATFPATDMKQFYVSVSRGRESVCIYTDDKGSLMDYAARVGDRRSALELLSPVKFSMTRKQREIPNKVKQTALSNITQPIQRHISKPTIQ